MRALVSLAVAAAVAVLAGPAEAVAAVGHAAHVQKHAHAVGHNRPASRPTTKRDVPAEFGQKSAATRAGAMGHHCSGGWAVGESDPTQLRTPVHLISHRRSGTHFTIHSLCQSFSEKLIISKSHASVSEFDAAMYSIDAWSLGRSWGNHRNFVFVHRDPADVMVSLFHFERDYAKPAPPKDLTLSQFIRTKSRKLPEFGNAVQAWNGHAKQWAGRALQHAGSMFLIDYAELYNELPRTMDSLGKFLGIPVGSVPSRKHVKVDAWNMRKGGTGSHEKAMTADDIKYIRSTTRDAIEKIAEARKDAYSRIGVADKWQPYGTPSTDEAK